MGTIQAILYLIAVVLVALAAFGVRSGRVSLALLGGACALLAYTLPTINAGI